MSLVVMMMHFSGTVNTAHEEYKYCSSTPTVCTQDCPCTLFLFQNPLSAKTETSLYFRFRQQHYLAFYEFVFHCRNHTVHGRLRLKN
jgi:hypothetical protein